MGSEERLGTEGDAARGAEVHREPPSLEGVLGTCLLFAGAGLVVLDLADRAAGLPFGMPRSWYGQRWIWEVLAFAAAAGGIALQRHRTQTPDDDWQPTGRPPRFRSLTLYTRDGCHLCDVARDTLAKYDAWLPRPEEVDIDADPALKERFDVLVPVVEIDGRIRFKGRVDEFLLRRLIEGTARQPDDGNA